MEETHDITLVWNYTLTVGFGLAKFSDVTGGGNVQIAKKFSGESLAVQPNFQDRFRADASDTQAWLTILTVQRSDQGRYQLDLTPKSGNDLIHQLELVVLCMYWITKKNKNMYTNV